MPVDYYPNKSVEQLTELLESLQKRQIKGGITEVTAAGVRTTRDFKNSFSSRTETEILRVRYSLYLRSKGGDQANDWPNPYSEKITRTRARYTFS